MKDLPEKSRANCPVCGSQLEGEITSCHDCQTPHHKECWDYVGHCAIFGCHQTIKSKALTTSSENAVELTKVSHLVTLYKVQWYLLSATVTSLLLIYFSIILLGATHRFMAYFATSLFPYFSHWATLVSQYVFRYLPNLGVLFGILYILMFGPTYLSLRKLELDNPIVPSSDEKALTVAQRLEPSTADSVLLKWLSFCKTTAALFIPLTILRVILRGRFDPFYIVFVVLISILMYVFARGLHGAATLRLTLFESLQNRVIASMKDKT